MVRYLILFVFGFLVNASKVMDDRENVVASAVQIPRGQSHELSFVRNIGEIFIEDPKVLDVQVLGPKKIRLFTLDMGETRVIVSDRLGNKLLEFKVEVIPNVSEVEKILRDLFPHLKIYIKAIKHVIFVSGKVPNPKTASEVMKIIKAYIKDDDQVINNLEISLPTQVMIKVKIAEVQREVSQNLGIDWSMFNHNIPLKDEGQLVTGDFPKGIAGAVLGGSGKINPEEIGKTVGEAFPVRNLLNTTDGSVGGTLLSYNKIRNGFSYNVSAFLDTIARESLATILAEPTLIALSGQTATFNSGGEVPYSTTSTTGTSNTEFKTYGISLEVTPTIISENLINIQVKPSVSDLGSTTQQAGPSLVTRDVSTTVELADGQSIVIAGLLKKNVNNVSEATSFLARIPILGALFKNNQDKNSEMELVIVLTAYIVRPVKETIQVPTDHAKFSGVVKQALFGQMNDKVPNDGKIKDANILPVTRDHSQGVIDHKQALSGG